MPRTLGRRPEPLYEAVADFDAERVQVLAVDVTQADALESAVAAVTERFGRLDVVVANAGISGPSDIDAFDDAAWERVRSVNLDAIRYQVPLRCHRRNRSELYAVRSAADGARRAADPPSCPSATTAPAPPTARP